MRKAMVARVSKKELSFEQGLERLEGIAQQMEQGELPLEELLKLYEEGAALSEKLSKKLDAAKARMQEVRADKSGAPELVSTDVVSQTSMLDDMEEDE